MVASAVVTKSKVSRREYLIQKKLHRLIPKYVPEPLSYRNGIMTSKKMGVSLKRWLNRQVTYDDEVLMQIIRNVRLILNKIRRKYPGFRHMDLHLDNLLIHRGRILIIDFGMSRFSAHNVSVGYDMHLFLNSMRHLLLKKGYRGRALKYIHRLLPEGWRGSNGQYVSKFRLKPNSAASIAKRLLGLRA